MKQTRESIPAEWVKNYITPDYKAKLDLGNTIIYLTKHYNWFNRKMLKLVFGLNIENIKEEK